MNHKFLMSTGFGFIDVPDPNSTLDPDALDWIERTESADFSLLEQGVRLSYNNFVVGCKEDNTWSKMKAAGLLMGAKTPDGAMTSIVGPNPFPAGQGILSYSRTEGMRAVGTTGGLNSGRRNDEDPRDSKHLAIFLLGDSEYGWNEVFMGSGVNTPGESQLMKLGPNLPPRINYSVSPTLALSAPQAGKLFGISRNSATTVNYRINGQSGTINDNSSTPSSNDIFIFRRGTGSELTTPKPMGFYSIGEDIDLELLEARVIILANQIQNTV